MCHVTQGIKYLVFFQAFLYVYQRSFLFFYIIVDLLSYVSFLGTAK